MEVYSFNLGSNHIKPPIEEQERTEAKQIGITRCSGCSVINWSYHSKVYMR